MAEIINPKDAEALKIVVGSLVKKVDELARKVDEVVTAQGKVDTSLQEFKEAKKSGAPVQFMKAETVEKAIEDKLNSKLVVSKVSVDVRNATIGKESKEKIDGLMKSTGSLITAANKLVESIKAIKPRRPLLGLTIYDGEKTFWLGVGLAALFLTGMFVAIVWANMKVNFIQDQAFYWGNRAYQAALLIDDEDPGKTYHMIMSHFTEYPDKAKEVVDDLEKRAKRYEEIKHYLISLIEDKDSRDIRVIKSEIDHGEGWFLYRFFDEETERSIHVWPDGRVEETTEKIVTDLASARKYSKRKIWRTIKEATDSSSDEESHDAIVQ